MTVHIYATMFASEMSWRLDGDEVKDSRGEPLLWRDETVEPQLSYGPYGNFTDYEHNQVALNLKMGRHWFYALDAFGDGWQVRPRPSSPIVSKTPSWPRSWVNFRLF